MGPKKETLPVLIGGVLVVALLAAVALIFAAYNSPGTPWRLGNMPRDSEPGLAQESATQWDSGSGNSEQGVGPVVDSRAGPNEPSNATSSQGEVNGWQDGDGEVRVAPQDGPVVSDTKAPKHKGEMTPTVNSHEQDALTLGEPTDLALAESENQVPLSATGEVSPSLPTPAITSQITVDAQAVPGTPAPALATFTSKSRAPLGEVGGPSVKMDDSERAPDSVASVAGQNANDQAISIPEKGALKYPNLGSHLNRLVTSVEAGHASAKQAAQGASIHSDGSIAVTIHLTGHVDEVVAFLEDNGGDPRNVGEDYIEAYVPVPLLGPVSERPGVIRVREIVPPQRN